MKFTTENCRYEQTNEAPIAIVYLPKETPGSHVSFYSQRDSGETIPHVADGRVASVDGADSRFALILLPPMVHWENGEDIPEALRYFRKPNGAIAMFGYYEAGDVMMFTAHREVNTGAPAHCLTIRVDRLREMGFLWASHWGGPFKKCEKPCPEPKEKTSDSSKGGKS